MLKHRIQQTNLKLSVRTHLSAYIIGFCCYSEMFLVETGAVSWELYTFSWEDPVTKDSQKGHSVSGMLQLQEDVIVEAMN